jgi:hypothetical protein
MALAARVALFATNAKIGQNMAGVIVQVSIDVTFLKQ